MFVMCMFMHLSMGNKNKIFFTQPSAKIVTKMKPFLDKYVYYFILLIEMTTMYLFVNMR